MPQVGVKFMSADKISHYMMSAMFLSRANAAVRKAVDRLKAKGIEPAYVIRCPEDAAQEVPGQVLKVSVSQSSIKPKPLKVALRGLPTKKAYRQSLFSPGQTAQENPRSLKRLLIYRGNFPESISTRMTSRVCYKTLFLMITGET